MAVIYLRHPVHGSKVACGEQEAQYDRANGWVDYDPAAPVVPAFLAPVEPVESDLPEDLPGRELLIAGGILTWEVLVDKTRDDLIAIKGIGPATADAILKVLNG